MVDVTAATGFAHVVQLNPVDGLHKKFPVPVAFSVVEFPMHRETSAPAFTAEGVRTLIATVLVLVQPMAVVPVTV